MDDDQNDGYNDPAMDDDQNDEYNDPAMDDDQNDEYNDPAMDDDQNDEYNDPAMDDDDQTSTGTYDDDQTSTGTYDDDPPARRLASDYYNYGRRLASDNSSNTTNATADVGSAAPLPRCRGCVIGDDDVADAETNTLGWAGEVTRIHDSATVY
jgi:hypothetical protein